MENLAEILKQIRLDSGESQAEFAKKIGVSQRTWSAYESGETRPKMATMLALSSMGYNIPDATTGAYQGTESAGSAGAALRQLEKQNADTLTIAPSQSFDVFRLKHGTAVTLAAEKTDFDALVLLPVYTQTAAAGRGQPETQLQEIDKYIPIVLEMLGGANPKNCGIVRVVGDSMTDMNLFNGDFVIFDRTQIDGDGVYVISIGADVRVKHLEYRPIERKIVISSENAKRYPNPEVISYEQAENLLRIHGKVISWLHRNPY
ncbi:MAG: helix-turn-helix domain-containing protein [Treponema sp.]|nr:helix-turn-helix domain-containing protein [Treponema sp.]